MKKTGLIDFNKIEREMEKAREAALYNISVNSGMTLY